MTYTKNYNLQLDGFALFLFIVGFTSLTCLFGDWPFYRTNSFQAGGIAPQR